MTQSIAENAPDQGVHVALVGHCGPDQWMLRSAVGSALPGARVLMINDEASLTRALTSIDVALVNRVLDGRFGDESGIKLIAALKQQAERGPALLLISNFADAQREAEAAGASPGFGKSEANSSKARSLLRQAAGLET